MKKLSMKVDELRVETFSIQTESDTRTANFECMESVGCP